MASISDPARRAPHRHGPSTGDALSVTASLTPRDRYLIGVLADQQVLTTHQIARLAFPSLGVAQRRLLRLHALGVLDRFRWHVIVGSQPWHYTLGPVGTTLVAASRGSNAPRLAAHRQHITRLAASPRLGHLLGINDFFTCLAEHARTHPDCGLEAWWSERRCAEQYGQLVRPDGFGRWVERTRRVEFFIEYDTGTEPLTRVAAKLPGYADLITAGGPSHVVLIWLPTANREANLHAALAKLRSTVAVATANGELTPTLAASPAGPVWLPVGATQRCRLIDLAARRNRPTAANTAPTVANPR